MKATKLAKGTALLLTLAVIGGSVAIAQPPREKSDDGCVYVLVTGSNIPQKVKVKRIGMLTTSPVTVYDRDDIHKSGRFSTEGVLAQDPDVQILVGRPGGQP